MRHRPDAHGEAAEEVTGFAISAEPDSGGRSGWTA
jgi:hypothetical protein